MRANPTPAQRSTLDRQNGARFLTTCFSLIADVMPMLTKSSLLPLVVMEPGEAGVASTRFSATSAAAVTWIIMNPDSRPGSAGEKRGQIFVECGIDQAIDTALGNSG